MFGKKKTSQDIQILELKGKILELQGEIEIYKKEVSIYKDRENKYLICLHDRDTLSKELLLTAQKLLTDTFTRANECQCKKEKSTK